MVTDRSGLSVPLECPQRGLQGAGELVGKQEVDILTVKEVLEILNYIYFRNTGNFHSQCQFLLQIVFSCIGWWGHEADASSVPSK